jgi:regulatory protein
VHAVAENLLAPYLADRPGAACESAAPPFTAYQHDSGRKTPAGCYNPRVTLWTMKPRRQKPLDPEALMQYALRALSGRALSISELRERLQKRAADAASAESVIARLRQMGCLDDRRFAESFALARKESQGFGRMRVLRDLRQRRVSAELAEKAVAEVYADADEAGMIDQFLARKYRGKDLAAFLAEERNLLAVFRRLRYAGFSAGASIRVLKRYAAQADELASAAPESDPV